MLRGFALLSLLGLAACNRSASGESASATTGVTSVSSPGDTSSGSSSGSSGSSTGSTTMAADVSTSTGASSGSTDGVPVPGDMPEFTAGEPVGCQGKIDFLFVISRSVNGGQAQLLTSFPGFIAAIQDLGADYAAADFHIMVVDGDDSWGSQACNADCSPEGCSLPDYPCDQLSLLDDCDFALGAGTIFNAGLDAPNEPCGLPALHRFVDGDNPALLELFICMATVGNSGGNALGDALAAAVSPALREGCNQGFLRDDALLFVTFIGGTDDNQDYTPYLWAKAVWDAKNGNKDAIVMLGIHPFEDLETCAEHGQGVLCQMLEMFPHRVFQWGGAPDFAPAFAEAVGLIDEACAELVPQ